MAESRTRPKLSKKLHEALDGDSVYYDPPESAKMKYPAIVYTHDDTVYLSADSRVYMDYDVYEVQIIAKDDDTLSAIGRKLAELVDGIKYVRSGVDDNLHHRTYRVVQY